MILQFLFCNVILAAVITLLSLLKHLLKHHLTARMQYNLWMPLMLLMAVPFLPFRYSWYNISPSAASYGTAGVGNAILQGGQQIEDFALSIKSTETMESLLTTVWVAGILIVLFFLLRSYQHLYRIHRESLPLETMHIQTLFSECLKESKITRQIPIYSTPEISSPAIAGILKPCIYLPNGFVSNADRQQIRCILLHELQHYKCRDNLVNGIMNFLAALYWFNPAVWYARKSMIADREIACDAAVLEILDDRQSYGLSLISLAETVSLSTVPFASSTMKQMKKRILHITSYRKPSRKMYAKSVAIFMLIVILMAGFTPAMSTYVASDTYHWQPQEPVQSLDCSRAFGNHHGSFVLYDETGWTIYNQDAALKRVSPASTWKIYDALIALEEGIITPEASDAAWNGETYPFQQWNTDQNLNTAMQNSVNWYFQNLDQQLGSSCIASHIHKIGYGNEAIYGNLSSYWMEGSLKISPVEQVQLLTRFYHNDLGYSETNIDSVKESIYLGNGLYGKTGTCRVDNQDVNGWFIGYVKADDGLRFFAVNICDGSGSNAAEIALSILDQLP